MSFWERKSLSKGWKSFEIQVSEKDKKTQQSKSRAHGIYLQYFNKRKYYLVRKVIDTMHGKSISTTAWVFNTVYSLAKRCKPFSDIEDEIELQIINGLDMRIGLYSRKTAVKIVDFIAKEIRK